LEAGAAFAGAFLALGAGEEARFRFLLASLSRLRRLSLREHNVNVEQ
jgi:hypothetical protein